MKNLLLASAICVLAAVAPAASSPAPGAVHPPALVQQSLDRLRGIDTLGALPAPIRRGEFALPGGTKSPGWALAAPGAHWNATDAVVDTTLPGRRMILAACNPALCILHYERGGIAHVYLVMALVADGGGWKAVWLAMGHPALANLKALAELLQNRSSLDYRDANVRIDY